jgi:hypothetical protein
MTIHISPGDICIYTKKAIQKYTNKPTNGFDLREVETPGLGLQVGGVKFL